MWRHLPLTFLALIFARPAQAAWPEDVVLSGLGMWNGSPVDQGVAMDAYRQVVNELGLAIANRPMAPGETLGVSGFEIGMASTVAFTDSRDTSAQLPSPWTRVHEDGDPGAVLWIPWLQARKGLPLSLEVGGNMGYVAFSRQTVFGGYGRWGLVEGYKPIPDLSIQVGYSGYVGNDELELGAVDMSATIGYTLPFGTLVGINQALFSPFLGVGTVRIHASPRLTAEEADAIGISQVSGFQKSEFYDPECAHTVLHGGFRIVSGDFQLRIVATMAPGTLATMNAGLGFHY